MEARQSHEWIAQFCDQLLKRMPEMPVRAAISRAIAAFPDAEAIYDNNIATLRRIGLAGWQALGRHRKA